MFKWIKNLFSKATNLVELKECKYCNGTGYTAGLDSDYRSSFYWCDCRKIDGKFPGECAIIDIRMETSYHTIIITGFNKNYDYDTIDLPEPNTIFEPYIKAYLVDGNRIDKIYFVKVFVGNKEIVWKWKDYFYDNKTYSDIITSIREDKLKELGIY